MLSRSILPGAAAMLLATASFAADLPSAKAAPDTFVPLFNWTGLYLGGNAGGAFGTQGPARTSGQDAASDAFVAAGGRARTIAPDEDGFTGGGQVGYNQQIGRYLFGMEADASYVDLSARRSVAATGGLSAIRHDLDFLGTVRGRVGMAFDRVLVYATGGLAYGEVDSRAAFYLGPSTASGLGYAGRRSGLDFGWAAGGGVEYALAGGAGLLGWGAVTVKAEALYYDLGSRTVDLPNLPGAAGPGYRMHFETGGVLARVGLNLKFGTF